jgi:hypothetical protein
MAESSEFLKDWEEYCEKIEGVLNEYYEKGYGIPIASITLTDGRQVMLKKHTISTFVDNTASVMLKLAILNDSASLLLSRNSGAQVLAERVVSDFRIENETTAREFISGMMALEDALKCLEEVAKRIEDEARYQADGSGAYQ